MWGGVVEDLGEAGQALVGDERGFVVTDDSGEDTVLVDGVGDRRAASIWDEGEGGFFGEARDLDMKRDDVRGGLRVG